MLQRTPKKLEQADVLERAAGIIETFGLLKHYQGNKREGYCAIGAISVAQYGETFALSTPEMETYGDAMGFEGESGWPIARWNNAPERTAQEVIDRLRAGAKRLREEALIEVI